MTVTNTNLRNDYTGNGATTVYAFTFTAIYEVGSAKYSLKVITTDTSGVETLKTQGTDYTVTLATNGTGTITFATAPTSGHKVSILPDMSLTQETDYVKSGSDKFPAESHEKALDKLTLIAKQFSELFKRSIKLPNNSLLSEVTVPVESANADKAIVVNSTGDGLDAKDIIDINLYPVSAFAATLLDDANAAEARATLGVVIGDDVQAYNENLAAFAALSPSANKVPRFTGSGSAMNLVTLRSASTTQEGLSILPSQIIISNNVSDPNNDIDSSAGVFQFSDGSGQAILSALTKRLDATWAAGTNQGGLFSGSKANSTRYYYFAIYNPTTGVSDAGFDTSITAANIPSGYTKYKYVGSIVTDGSGNIRGFQQSGATFYYNQYIVDRSRATPPTSPTNVTLTVAPNSIALTTLYVENSGGAYPDYILLVNPSYANTTPSSTNYTNRMSIATSFTRPINVLVNSSSVAVLNANAAAGFCEIVTQGYIDQML